MKRRKNHLLLIALVLACTLLTACGCSSNDTKVVETETATEAATEATTEATEATTEATEAATEATEAATEATEATEAATEATTEPATEYGNLQIQSLDGITLDGNPELPCKLIVHSEATEAVNNPLKITVESENKKGEISFSYISSDSKLNSITKGMILQTNKNISYTRSSVSYVGNIATFSISMPLNLENATTAIYELSFRNGDDYYDGYIAFAFTITQ